MMTIDFRPGELTPGFEDSHITVTLTGSDQLFRPADGSRVYLAVWAPLGAAAVSIAPYAMNTEVEGYALEDIAPSPRVFLYRDIGPIIGREWHVRDAFGFGEIHFHEVLYKPNFLRSSMRSRTNVPRRREAGSGFGIVSADGNGRNG